MGKRGPKKWIPSPEELARIEALAGSGMTQEEICLALGVGQDAYYDRKREIPEISQAIKSGKTKAHAMVHSALMAKVRSGDLGAIVWYEKSRRGMTDRINLTGQAKVVIEWGEGDDGL